MPGKPKQTSFDLTRTSPVQVRLKKPKRLTSTQSNLKKRDTTNGSKSKASSSKSKQKRPFIPPPGKASPSRPFSWESKSHRLDINPPPLSSTRSKTMHMDELSTSDDEDKMYPPPVEKYESKIDKLLNDVSLSEREYLKSKTHEQLAASRRLIEDQEQELDTYKKNLNVSFQDRSLLERSYDMVKKEAELSKNEAKMLVHEKDNLLKKLVDIEHEGKEASYELNKLKDTCRKLKKDQRYSEVDIKTLSNQRDMLLDKLEEFELANKNLRRLLRETQKKRVEDEDLSDRCTILMRKLTSAEAKLQDQAAQLVDQDKQIDTLIAKVETDKQQGRIFDDLQKTMEVTREHLQSQLHQKSSECDHLHHNLEKLQNETTAQCAEVEHYQSMLTATRDKSQRDKEALKKATRLQRERAQGAEHENEKLQKQIGDLLVELEQSKTTLVDLTGAHKSLKQDKECLEDEAKILRRNVMDIGETLELSTKSMKGGPVHVADKLCSKVRHLKTVKEENGHLKEELKVLEDNLHSNEKELTFKLRNAETEIGKLRAALDQFERLSTDYKTQLEHYRSECSDLHNRLRQQDDTMTAKLKESMHEVNDVRNTLQSKILELEPYPELLKTSEIRLQETQDRCNTAERKLSDQTHIMAELTQKVEMLTEQLDHLREKYRSKHDECKHIEHQMNAMERQMQSTDGSQRELIQSLSRKDENLALLQERFDSQRIENERLIHQLEVALTDAKKQAETQKEKSMAKERSAQARIMDLESQLSRSTQSTQLLKRTKEEAERKFNTRLQDMRDRLEQANTTTRSMQSYVQFLKSTYANVFTDEAADLDARRY